MESKEGEGSAFFFKMPFGRAPGPGDTRSASERAAAERPEPNRNLRILLLEDEADIRELITMLLKNKGWEVITATSGEEGLFAWEKERFDLILMDLRMPMMDGFEAPAHPGKGRTWSRACSDHRTDRPCHEERLGKVSAVRNGRLSGQTFQERGVSGSD